jgi:hypothetical protein
MKRVLAIDDLPVTLDPVDPKRRIVTQLPLRGLWRDSETINASRSRALSSANLRDLLRRSTVHFVVVDVGRKPRWIELEDCYRFWMDEVQHHLVAPEAKLAMDQMPGVYCYRASEWQSGEIASPIVVLEVQH